jgi:hypothetical protein
MYHPELQPELAAKNIKNPQPLPINSNMISKERRELTKQKAKPKQEITILSNGENNNIQESLGQTIRSSSKNSRVINPDNYSNRFEVEPILEEISEIGSRYFSPDNNKLLQKAQEKNKQMYLAMSGNSIDADINTSPEDEEFIPNNKNISNVNIAAKIYSQEIKKQNKKLDISPLRDLLIEMKKNNYINPRLDIRFMPHPSKMTGNVIGGKIFDKNSERLNEREQLNKLMSRLNSVEKDELNLILNDFQVNSKEELKATLQNTITDINQELYATNKEYLEKKEKKKIVERKKQITHFVKNLKANLENANKKAAKKPNKKAGLRKRQIEKKIKI